MNQSGSRYLKKGALLLTLIASGCVVEDDPIVQEFQGESHVDCEPSTAACAPDASCLAEGKGLDWAGAACIAMADHEGKSRTQLRVSQLEISSPDVLKKPFMQASIITAGITPTRSAACRQEGTNRFNVLFDLDFEAKTMKQGASIPQSLLGQKVDKGTCWADFSAMNHPLKSKISPAIADLTYDESSGQFEALFPSINIPIYVNDNHNDFALLPLRELLVTGTLSAGNNCIGSFKAEDLEAPQCAADFKWENKGEYVGYVTVVEADDVDVSSLGYSLCTLLSGDAVQWKSAEEPIGRCRGSSAFEENGGELPEGNWCSVSNSADAEECGGKFDAWQLKTEFAASAVLINGDCPSE